MSYLFNSSISLKSMLVLLVSAVIVTSVEHTTGSANIFGSGDVLQKIDLFNKNAVKQSNYTIRYKYIDSSFGGAIFFAQMNVTGAQNSTSEMDYSKEIDVDHRRFVDATIHVLNATNFTSSIEVRGFHGIYFDRITLMMRSKQFKPRSYAFICTQNDAKVKSQQKPLIEFGKRIPGDFLIRYRHEHSGNGKLNFDYHDPYLKLTYIVVNVDSPWAITFTNKIIITEDRFRATVYELERNNFSAEMFIFGTKTIRT